MSIAGGRKPTGVYWWCTECADSYWKNFSGSYYHSALFDHAGVAVPAQKAWGSTPLPPSACVQSLEAACPWVDGKRTPFWRHFIPKTIFCQDRLGTTT